MRSRKRRRRACAVRRSKFGGCTTTPHRKWLLVPASVSSPCAIRKSKRGPANNWWTETTADRYILRESPPSTSSPSWARSGYRSERRSGYASMCAVVHAPGDHAREIAGRELQNATACSTATHVPALLRVESRKNRCSYAFYTGETRRRKKRICHSDKTILVTSQKRRNGCADDDTEAFCDVSSFTCILALARHETMTAVRDDDHGLSGRSCPPR